MNEQERQEILAHSHGFFLDGSKEEVVLVLHGFSGTPSEHTLTAQALREAGYSVSAICLPHHGTSLEDFDHSRFQDWVAAVEKEYQRLKGLYAHVYVLGLSMGGLLTLRLAEKFPVEKIVLYAPAIIYKKKSNVLGFLILPFKKHLPWQGACHFEGGTEKYIVGYPSISVKASVEMTKLQRLVKKNLKAIHSPLLVVQGKKDQQVDPREPYYLTKHVSSDLKEIVFLPKSDHIIPLDCQKDQAFAETIAFLKSPSL